VSLKPARKRRKAHVAIAKPIVINGPNDVTPYEAKLYKKDWVAWFNATSKAYTITFTLPNPLKDASGHNLPDNRTIRIPAKSPSDWYQLKRRIKKGDKQKYTAQPSGKRGGPDGPEIIPQD
jgi:hypothetical protein